VTIFDVNEKKEELATVLTKKIVKIFSFLQQKNDTFLFKLSCAKLKSNRTVSVIIVNHKTTAKYFHENWGQFHQRSTHSFYAGRLTPVKYKPKT
jgi:hypothetical protein